MAKVSVEPGNRVRAGGGAMGITVASAARDAGIAGLEFLRGIPVTVGGAVRMNAVAYGRDTSDLVIEEKSDRRRVGNELYRKFKSRRSALPQQKKTTKKNKNNKQTQSKQ